MLMKNAALYKYKGISSRFNMAFKKDTIINQLHTPKHVQHFNVEKHRPFYNSTGSSVLKYADILAVL